jgi:hypothetical protein
MAMNTEAKTSVKTQDGRKAKFKEKVLLHQDLVWSPLLFVSVIEKIMLDARTELPWNLLYGNNLV